MDRLYFVVASELSKSISRIDPCSISMIKRAKDFLSVFSVEVDFESFKKSINCKNWSISEHKINFDEEENSFLEYKFLYNNRSLIVIGDKGNFFDVFHVKQYVSSSSTTSSKAIYG